MDPSQNTNDLISRLLNSNLQSNSLEENQPSSDENLMNFTPEQLEMLAKLYSNQTGENVNEKKDFKSFLPEQGFCLKTKTQKDEKIFINICKSDEIGSPKDLSEQELMKLIDDMDPANAAYQFRIPMSLGEPHSELDNSGEACLAYDVCINSSFFQKIQEKSIFMGFFMSVAIEGLEEKYSIKLDRNCKMLKNKKFMGKIQEQFIRTKSKPLIAEMNNDSSTLINKNPNIQEIQNNQTKGQTPKYKLIREPPEGDVEFLVAEIELPNQISAKTLTLDVGEDRILLNTRSGYYNLDIYLPFNINQEECGAQFDKKSKILTITMPVTSI